MKGNGQGEKAFYSLILNSMLKARGEKLADKIER
jgi:hypothetical protein